MDFPDSDLKSQPSIWLIKWDILLIQLHNNKPQCCVHKRVWLETLAACWQRSNTSPWSQLTHTSDEPCHLRSRIKGDKHGISHNYSFCLAGPDVLNVASCCSARPHKISFAYPKVSNVSSPSRLRWSLIPVALGTSLAHLPFKRHPIQRPPSVILQFLPQISLKLRRNHFGAKTTSCFQFAGWTALTRCCRCAQGGRTELISRTFFSFRPCWKTTFKIRSAMLVRKVQRGDRRVAKSTRRGITSCAKVGQQQRRRWEAKRRGSCKKTAGRGRWWEWTHYRGPLYAPIATATSHGGQPKSQDVGSFCFSPFRWEIAELGLVGSEKQPKDRTLESQTTWAICGRGLQKG